MSQLAIEIIAKEKKKKTGILDLGNCGLTEIPKEVFELVWLTELALSNEYWDSEKKENIKSVNQGNPNRLKRIPAGIKNLVLLETLRLDGTFQNPWKISDISVLQQLKELKILNVSYNQISKLENLPQQLNSLYIGSNQISKLENLPQHLNSLYISSNQISKLENLPQQLNSLDIADNQISMLENLPNSLNILNISENQIRKIENLPHSLKSLHIFYNQINKLENLPNRLNYLDIRSNPISMLENLPSSLSSLFIRSNQVTRLENLPDSLYSIDISSNPISKLENLPDNLNSLDISSNQISKLENLPKSLNLLEISYNKIRVLEKLPEGLNSLYISGNQINSLNNLPDSLNSLNISYNQIGKLENLPLHLNSLYIGSNQISKLENLPPQLNSLSIYNNKISKLENLPSQLNSLDISYNQISKLENLPPQLNSLDIRNNKIEDLTGIKDIIFSGLLNPVWERTYSGSELVLENNPLTTPPPEIIKKGREAVNLYFKELEEQGEVYLYEAKVLVVGDARVGKTTLCEKLKDINAPLPKEEESTKGIDIFPLNFRNNGNEFNANIWDFGGQEIYHSTHQFFLTKRSLYIFVDDNSRDDIEYDYWFQVIELFSSKSPVIVVQNRKAERHKEFDARGYKARFENINEVFSIDLSLKTSEDKEKFQKLEKAIQYELSTLPHIGQKLPKQWVEIRKKIGELAQSQSTLPISDYFNLCIQKDIIERDRALNLSSFLHDLGVFLHFQEDDLLRKTLIIRKEWATNAVYKILDDKQVETKHGRFCKNDAINIWKKSDYEEMYAEFLGIMKTFELIYTLADTNEQEFLIPKLLPLQQPVFDWDFNNNIQMKFEYDFMPKGLISRFIVRQNRHIKNQDLIWRKGVILEKNNSKALVKENYGSKKIEVWAKGPFSKDLMTIIKDDFDALHERFEGLKVKKLIPCNCSKCAKSEIPHFYEYESLLRRMEKERYTVECDISYENVSVQGLLDGIFVKNISEMKTNECAKILISYSKNDVKKAEKLKFYLKQFDDVYNINVWYDGDLRCGDEWDPEIKRQLQSADLIIFLVSNSFLATGYIKDIEIKTAIERHSKNEVKLMPVILSSCNWQSKVNPLRHIISYPDKIKTVADFAIEGNEDEAWTRVIKKIEEFLDEGNL